MRKPHVFPETEWAMFRTLAALGTPRPLRILAIMILIIILGGACFLAFVPWIQTAAGTGAVITRNPGDRVQTLTALVSGRIERWFVEEGAEVRAGDEIVRLIDNDPLLIERLEGERAAMERQLEASKMARETALLDYERKQRLFDQGLASQLDFESARIRLEEMKAREASAAASLNRAEVALSRMASQVVRAPRDGIVLRLHAGDNATMVREGQPLATFMPTRIERVVEIFVDGRDAPLVAPGRRARVMFEGWPAVQFSGWPAVAVGTFGGIVRFVDPAATADGRFRILIAPDPDDLPWPEERFLRLGSAARATVLLDSVPVGYELWRRFNNFPPLLPAATGLETLP